MPLILQAENQGLPIINLTIPRQHQERWDGWLNTLALHQDFLQLGQMFSLLNQPFHLSARDQNIIISNASPVLGQEIQEFIGSLLRDHNRQSQIWTNLNAAAAAEHRSEVMARDVHTPPSRLQTGTRQPGRQVRMSLPQPSAH